MSVKSVLKQVAWYAYAVLATVLTLGLFLRFHLVTVRLRKLGGVRAGVYGCTHVYRASAPGHGGEFLVISTWSGKERYPVNRIAYAQTSPLTVRVESSGGKVSSLSTWGVRTVSDYINAQVHAVGA